MNALAPLPHRIRLAIARGRAVVALSDLSWALRHHPSDEDLITRKRRTTIEAEQAVVDLLRAGDGFDHLRRVTRRRLLKRSIA